jgi:trehalose/maltose transport system permease protein
MTTVQTHPSLPDKTANRTAAELVAGVFFLMALAVFAALIAWVAMTEEITLSESNGFQAHLWNTLRTVGVLRPLLLIMAGVGLIRLSHSLRRGDIGAVRWAYIISNWLIVISSVALTYVIINAARANGATARDIFAAAFPVALLLVLTVGIRRGVVQARSYFGGDEDITARRTRHAWNLLAPTIITFLLIAIGPLERVLVTSLSDERFASSDEVSFVGLENYARLWSLRIDTINCNGVGVTCEVMLDENGQEQIVYPRLRRLYDDLGINPEYSELRFRELPIGLTLGNTHYILSARDPDFMEAFVTSVYYTLLATIFQLSVGFAIALILASQLRGIGFMRLMMLVPMAIPTLIATQFWDVMLRPDQTGLINAMLMGAGLIDAPQQWLLTPQLQVPTLVAVIVWKEAPVVALLLLPGLLAIPREVYQAAAIDGANRWQRFTKITLPMMRPHIGVVLVLRTMVFIRVFDLFEILVGRTRYVMSTYAYDVLLQRQQLGYASAVSVTIFIIAIIFTIGYMRTLRIDEV